MTAAKPRPTKSRSGRRSKSGGKPKRPPSPPPLEPQEPAAANKSSQPVTVFDKTQWNNIQAKQSTAPNKEKESDSDEEEKMQTQEVPNQPMGMTAATVVVVPGEEQQVMMDTTKMYDQWPKTTVIVRLIVCLSETVALIFMLVPYKARLRVSYGLGGMIATLLNFFFSYLINLCLMVSLQQRWHISRARLRMDWFAWMCVLDLVCALLLLHAAVLLSYYASTLFKHFASPVAKIELSLLETNYVTPIPFYVLAAMTLLVDAALHVWLLTRFKKAIIN